MIGTRAGWKDQDAAPLLSPFAFEAWVAGKRPRAPRAPSGERCLVLRRSVLPRSLDSLDDIRHPQPWIAKKATTCYPILSWPLYAVRHSLQLKLDYQLHPQQRRCKCKSSAISIPSSALPPPAFQEISSLLESLAKSTESPPLLTTSLTVLNPQGIGTTMIPHR